MGEDMNTENLVETVKIKNPGGFQPARFLFSTLR